MKIAIDAREMAGAVAGKGRYVVELVKALAAIDDTNTYYLYSKKPIDLKLPTNFQFRQIGGLPGLRQLWLALDCRRLGCDLLLAPTGYLPVVFSLIPTVVTVHDLALFITKDARPAVKTLIAEKLLLGLAIRRARHILAVSQSTKRDLNRLFNVPASKITVTPLGYDTDAYTPKATNDAAVLAKYNLHPGYLLFLGTLEPRKNIVGLIRAYAALDPALRQQYRLVIGGKRGWFYEEIFATVQALGLEKSVQFLGRVPDEHLPALYRQAKLFLFPSFYEGFGLPPLEAMACGTPVISSDISSLPEVVGKAGWLIDPQKTEELTEALTTALTKKEAYDVAAKATAKQASRFSWQTTAEETLEVLTKL